MTSFEEQLSGIGKRLDAIGARVNANSTAIVHNRNRIGALEGEPVDPPPPGDDLPFGGQWIFKYSGAEMVAVEPAWPIRFNSAAEQWEVDLKRRDLSVELPGGRASIVVPFNLDYQPPRILDDGRISWRHVGLPKHSQVRFRVDHPSMGKNAVYLRPRKTYGLSCDCAYPRWPRDWVQLLQLYGRVNPELSDGFKDVAAVFHRNGLFANVYGKAPTQNKSESVPVSGSLRLAIEIHGGSDDGIADYCKFWESSEGEEWNLFFDYDGTVGTGEPVNRFNYYVPNWGPYTSAEIGQVIYDNIEIRALD